MIFPHHEYFIRMFSFDKLLRFFATKWTLHLVLMFNSFFFFSEVGWPPWNGGSLEHGLVDEWSTFSSDANAPALSTAIASYVEVGEMAVVCSVFDLFRPLTFESKALVKVWDQTVDNRRWGSTSHHCTTITLSSLNSLKMYSLYDYGNTDERVKNI